MDDMTCHHCGRPAGDSPYGVTLQGLADDYRLRLCRTCQAMRQGGQLPVEMLIQQWAYARSGSTADEAGEAAEILVQLECLGCGVRFSSFAQIRPGSEPLILPESRRLPDGSLSTVCAGCHRTNVLERRGGQLVAVRLW